MCQISAFYERRDELLIHVVAGAVFALDGRVLIAERPQGKHLAGHWEFPGGKLEPDESRAQGLARELAEELGISIRDPRPLMRVQHRYPSLDVLIDFWAVSQYSGEPRGREGQRLRWCSVDELTEAGLLLADRPLVRALRLPERLLHVSTSIYDVGNSSTDGRIVGQLCITDDDARLAESAGAEFIAMSHRLDPCALMALAESLRVPLFAFGIGLSEARDCGCSGVNEIAASSFSQTVK